MSIDLSQFHEVFFEESFEGLDAMESCLLEFDLENPDLEDINTIFRSAHSIKGGSGTFGFSSVADFTHVLETVLDQVRQGERQMSTEMVDLMLRSVDCMKNMLVDLQSGNSGECSEASGIVAALEVIMGVEGGDKVPDSEKVTTDESESLVNSTSWKITFSPYKGLFCTGNEPLRMLRELSDLGDYSVDINIDSVPSIIDIDPTSCYVSWVIHLSGDIAKAEIDEVFEWVEDDADISIVELTSETPNDTSLVEEETKESSPTVEVEAIEPSIIEDKKPKSAKPAQKSTEASSIRVSTEKIDSLVNMVGELVITQSMLSQVGNEFDMSKLESLREGLAQLDHNTRELQENVMRIRMLPISFAFNRVPRMVRDISKKLEKQVELVISGENTELDKTVLEKITDPLVHLVRNAIDHGIEVPAERTAAGKDALGTMTLNAYHQGGNICIEIVDDGKGLDTDKLLKKAIKNGLVSESDKLSKEQIFDLIFQPGFSTAEVVSDVSGRGVGMDVVRRNIQELNGTVEVESELGKGSTFRIRLPLTLAILDGQLTRVGNQTYIVPLVSIVESLQVDTDRINHVAGGCDVFRLREEYIPIVNLWEIFDLEPESREISNGLLVVLEVGSEKVALVVDDLLSQQQVVIKSMESNYQKVDGVSGATILGDGTVALILEITDLIKMAGIRHNTYKNINIKKESQKAA